MRWISVLVVYPLITRISNWVQPTLWKWFCHREEVPLTEILKIDDKDVCRCKIVGLSPDQEDTVHAYILARQKEEIAQKKGKSF